MAEKRKNMSWKREGNLIMAYVPERDGSAVVVHDFDCTGIVDFAKLEGVAAELMFYGIKQFLADKTAGLRNPTASERIAVMDARFIGLQNGEFKVNAKGEFLRIDKKAALEALSEMPEKEQKRAQAVLAALHIKL